jgi:DNA mismatch repair protein MutH
MEKRPSNRTYDPSDALSIFNFSRGLLHRSLTEAVRELDSSILPEDLEAKGKGSLGQLVEKFYYGYEPNSSPLPDFPEAGVELKTTPLKKNAQEELVIKERLVCDMIDFCEIVNTPFEQSPFYRKSLLMLILFYLHVKGKKLCDLEFLFSVLWKLDGKDLLIIRHDYEVIINKIKEGKAHELSEGDTMYLGACRKGQKGDPLRKQPYSEIGAPKRAFSLKPAYMRTVLAFIQSSGKDMDTNTNLFEHKKSLVSEQELQQASFEHILTKRLLQFKGQDYRQIAEHLHIQVCSKDKSRYARVTAQILLKGLNNLSHAEEIQKAGIIVKTIRMEADGNIRESMSFENIDYQEVYETSEWTDSRWYEIVTSRFMFIVYRATSSPAPAGWENETRYLLDRVIFWTMPTEDLYEAEAYWENIRQNILQDTLQNQTNTFWKIQDKRNFHVRPKAQKGTDRYYSPISHVAVPKKAYWFNQEYVKRIIEQAYDEGESSKIN